jgi:hypothetical protein
MKNTIKLLPVLFLVIFILFTISCTPKIVVIQQPAQTTNTPVYVQPAPTTTYTPTQQQTNSTQWAWQPSPGNLVNGGSYAYFPLNGAYVSSGKTLTLSWSADGNMDAFILTSNQYNNFKPFSVASTWMTSGNGPNGTISVYIQNGDTYYAIVRNTFIGSPVKLYQAVLTAR